MKLKINLLYLLLILMVGLSCSKKDDGGSGDNSNTNTNTGGGTGGGGGGSQYPAAPSNPNGYPTIITTDCSVTQGNVMKIEQANVISTTAALPSEKGRTWLQGLHHNTIRVWLALSTINNKGYNYKYDSGVNAEDALTYYSTCSDSLLVCLSAYTGTASSPVPARPTAFQTFLTQTLLYYKTKFPKIKYIEAGNEPDYLGETVSDYYDTYKYYYKAVNAVNAQLALSGNNRLMLSNAPFTNSTSTSTAVSYTFTAPFLSLYAADPDATKKLDFFSIHCYSDQSQPSVFKNAKAQVLSAMNTYGVPATPVFVTEFGMVGGDFVPTVWSESDMVSAWPSAQLAKAFYLYEGGADRVFNWCINHGTIIHKCELGDLTNAYPYPYGNALLFAKEISARGTRVKVTSNKLATTGLGINALASMGNSQGVAVLVWNYNYTNSVADQNINVQLSNIPSSAFGAGKMNVKIYMLDAANNNFYNNSTQTSLATTLDATYAYSASLNVPVKLTQNSVALIVVNP